VQGVRAGPLNGCRSHWAVFQYGSGLNFSFAAPNAPQGKKIVHLLNSLKFLQGKMQPFQGSQFALRPKIFIFDIDDGTIVRAKLLNNLIIDFFVRMGLGYQAANASVHFEPGKPLAGYPGNTYQKQQSEQSMICPQHEKSEKHNQFPTLLSVFILSKVNISGGT